ncbi:hypothetical protein [Streptomyces sp. 8N616]|uniref:hypothetical protein n=1 Tax=Streptomyces sp. 8N616 TaxID=3457414 RepID=UPI003FD597AC
METAHSMPGMEGMPAHAAAGAVTSSGSTAMWRLAFGLLAVYFLASIALSVRSRLRGRGQPVTLVSGSCARHRRPNRAHKGLLAPNTVLAGQVGMGGCMATMLIMMAA